MNDSQLPLIEKKSYRIPELKLENGAVLKNIHLGYESYGKLNEAGDNAILIPHYYSGTSHAAGRYAPDDLEPGYWDKLIGPGKAIDTDKYFVFAGDSLCNLQAKSPNVITTGPRSINPETGKRYGLSFPVVSIGDMVQTQKALCDQLGVKKLHAVVGPSMGSITALQWSAMYPDFVDRVIAVIPGGLEAPPYLIMTLNSWCAPIYQDPKFNDGNYTDDNEPAEGLKQALKNVTLTGVHYGWAQRLFGRRENGASPTLSLKNHHAIEDALEATATERMKMADANSFLYIARAVQSYSITHLKNRIKARCLFLPAKSDLLLFPDYAKQGAEELRTEGVEVQLFELDGDGGHLDGIYEISQAAGTIRRFLES